MGNIGHARMIACKPVLFLNSNHDKNKEDDGSGDIF